MKFFVNIIGWLVLISVCFVSCKKSKPEEPQIIMSETSDKKEFSRQVMLTNLADNLISPSLLSFKNQSDSLNRAAIAFTNNPNQLILDSLQARLDKAWNSWQYCGWFRYGSLKTQFGSIEGIKKMDEINTFPIDSTKLEAYISSGGFTLTNPDYDTRGLGAIDYLINSPVSGDSNVISKFNLSGSRSDYLKAITASICTRADEAYNAWLTEKIIFLKYTGTDAASSTSSIFLDIDVDLDNVKNNKVGIPVGRIQAGQVLPSFPESTEAFYNGNSILYLKSNLLAIENIWRGRSVNGSEGVGFDDYLLAVNAGGIHQLIINQFALVDNKLNAIPSGRLSDIIKTNPEPVRDLYNELQKLAYLLKTDMNSALGLTISYSSGDGD